MSLYLQRYKGEEIQIGEDITVRVSQTRDNSVILKFDAPKEISIDRMEIYQQKKLSQEQQKI